MASVWVIEVQDSSGARLLALSIEFLQKGNVWNWAYVAYALSCCVADDVSIVNLDGSHADHTQVPIAVSTASLEQVRETCSHLVNLLTKAS